MSALFVENITFSYPNSEKKAVDNVSFTIEKGSYTALVGANGSGKSTLSKIICGLELPSSGKVTVQEGSRIGLVFQSPKNQLVSSIVSRDTAFGPQNLGIKKSEVELRTIECLSVTDMLDKALSSTSALSLGQTQKVAVSGMLAIWPDILILDEALAMLDEESRKNMYEILSYWHKSGNTIIHITHSLDSIKQADNVIAMEKGRMIFYGTTKAFFEDEELVEKIRGPELLPSNRTKVFEKVTAEQNAVSDSENTGENAESLSSLVFDNVCFSYDKKSSVKNISFSLQKGTLTALSGPSGAGKSTILELAAGLLERESGTIYAKNRASLVQQNCESALFESFAADDVAFGPKNQGVKGKKLKALVKDSMDKASIPFSEFADRHTSELSGGEQRRLAIAGILALNSEIVLFDEPTAGLDGYARYNVMQMLRKLADEGKTVLFSTHKADEIAFSDREIRIKNGCLVSDSQVKIFEQKAEATPVIQKTSVTQDAHSTNVALPVQDAYSAAGMISSLRNSSAKLAGHEKLNISPVQKLPPVVRILLFLTIFTLTLVFRNVWLNTAMFVLSLIYCKLCGFKFKNLLSAELKILPFLLLFTIMQLVFRPSLPDEVHFTTWKWFTISPSKLLFCLSSLLRTYASLAIISGFFVSIPEYDLIDGLKILLTPLEKIKIPVRYFILIIEIIFRFIPILIDEACGIIKTQVIRGGMGQAKTRMQKIKAVIPLVVPLIIQTIKRSDALAAAVTMRGFK
ncbi:MAG: ATP-binding cassette domain-containing protein [Treponema sp.]|nr:ATP-binding cassette domain-containing protein [Treponema sp.]